MRISLPKRLGSTFLGLLLAASAVTASAQSGPCDDISRDVAAAIQKDPSKVLMIVEDALVINESCACEIIKAAINASKADPTMVNQIVQTGIAVAPKMSGVIMDCATAASPNTSITSQVTAVVKPSSGKEPVKEVVLPPPPVEDDTFNPVPSSIRGVYLIQPPPTGRVPCDPKFRKCCNCGISPVGGHPGYP